METKSRVENAYDLLPPELNVPAWGATEEVCLKDKMIYARLFDAYGSWTWYICEYDPEEEIAFGFVDGAFGEWGDIYIPELKELMFAPGVPRIERDLWFEPITFTEAKDKYGFTEGQ